MLIQPGLALHCLYITIILTLHDPQHKSIQTIVFKCFYFEGVTDEGSDDVAAGQIHFYFIEAIRYLRLMF